MNFAKISSIIFNVCFKLKRIMKMYPYHFMSGGKLMSNINFTTVENGYSPEQVDKYISMLQQEYENAVSWGEENENKLKKLISEMEKYGVYFTIDENNQNEVIERVFDELYKTVEKVRQEAEQEAVSVVAKANDKARSIVKQAMESSVELRQENETVMKNLKSISEMIDTILDKVSQ